MGERRDAHRILVGKPERRPKRRWEDNIRMKHQEVGWVGGKDWIDLAQNRDRWRAVVIAAMNPRVP